VTAAQADPLPGSEWEPVSLRAEPFAPAAEIFLRFEGDGRFFGNGGCNTFRGAFVTNGDAILFSPAASTMMACPEPILGEEHSFLRALDTVRGFERDGTRLVLRDAAGAEVLELRQRDAD
jgi:heat shock protein HslJ